MSEIERRARTDLNAAIKEILDSGVVDPGDVLAELHKRYDASWLRTQMAAIVDVELRERIRRIMSSERTAVIRASQEGHESHGESPELAILNRAKFVPGVGWKEIGDLTAVDCLAIAEQYARLAEGAGQRAAAFTEFARLIQSQRVKTLRQVRKLPLELMPARRELEAI